VSRSGVGGGSWAGAWWASWSQRNVWCCLVRSSLGLYPSETPARGAQLTLCWLVAWMDGMNGCRGRCAGEGEATGDAGGEGERQRREAIGFCAASTCGGRSLVSSVLRADRELECTPSPSCMPIDRGVASASRF
jgi:hypothetical protein